MKTLTLHPFNHAGQYRGMEARDNGVNVYCSTTGSRTQDHMNCSRYAKVYGYDLVETTSDDTSDPATIEMTRIATLPNLAPEALHLVEAALSVQRGEKTLKEVIEALPKSTGHPS